MEDYYVRVQELSDKVLIIQGNTLLNQDGLKMWSDIFAEHGFKVIWLTI